jgi:hypothetical protein
MTLYSTMMTKMSKPAGLRGLGCAADYAAIGGRAGGSSGGKQKMRAIGLFALAARGGTPAGPFAFSYCPN